jgi:glycosyltransferase involved in cell wall biosynthesis
VVIVTHNRKKILDQAIQSVLKQNTSVEIIVMDDASSDGTGNMMQECFPQVTYHRSEKSRGPSYQRNEGMQKATSSIVIFLDDDTVLQDENTIRKTVEDFDTPLIGAVAMPVVNILQGNTVRPAPPVRNGTYVVHAFIAAAFAVRKSCFEAIGGFRESYFYMGEEGDLCIRMLNAGWYVKAGSASPVYHLQPAGRTSFAADFYGRRNDIYFLYMNAPKSSRIGGIAATVCKGIWFGIKVGRLGNMLKGIASGFRILWSNPFEKPQPIRKAVYQHYRFLKKHEPLQWEQAQII